MKLYSSRSVVLKNAFRYLYTHDTIKVMTTVIHFGFKTHLLRLCQVFTLVQGSRDPKSVWKHFRVDKQKWRLLETMAQTPMFTSWFGSVTTLQSHDPFLKKTSGISPDSLWWTQHPWWSAGIVAMFSFLPAVVQWNCNTITCKCGCSLSFFS